MSRDHHRRRTLRIASREITLVLGFGLLVLVVVGLAAGVVSRSAAQHQALRESGRATRTLADVVVAPLVPALLEHAPGSREALDRAVGYGLAEGPLAEVTIWHADGSVAYSTNPSVRDQRFVPPPEVVKAVQGTPSSRLERPDGAPLPAVEDGVSPTSPPPTGDGAHVEVYVPLEVPGRETLAFAAAYDNGSVSGISTELLQRFLPLILAPLILLQLIQLPAALSLANRLRRKEDERHQLFSRALEVSDRERARFAADLHDGPVQELSGVGYALGAIAPAVPAAQAPMLARIQEAVQRSVDSLRSLMTDLYPPDLDTGTLAQAVNTLAQPLREAGVAVELDLDGLPDLERETAVTLYRVTREVLANVEKHAHAQHVTITGSAVPGAEAGGDRVRLVVADDGVGADPRRLDRRREGHLGLRLVIDRVQNAGGRFTLTSSPGHGTRVEAEMPVVS